MVDVITQLGAVSRAVAEEEREGEPSRVQSLEQTYPSPIDDVWEAVTSAERIERWFMPVEGELALGGRYQLVGNAGGKVLECEPPSEGTARYRITWEFGGGMSWVTVSLAEQGAETRLVLEHVARVADVPQEMWDTFGPGATGVGWDGGLLGLSLHLGGIHGKLAPEEAEAWAATAEGRQFYRGAADAWAAAHVASGADAGVAARNADATFGFYTGEPG
ncbi:polyketide cyclase [Tessaracoccus rhinocerotis]|uniref:Polyketide cyclase n=1 Tax=Tessaracoccus rhinocerotis TaxID=1689449 RepID=A0A553K1F4_9ACTN|nr:SRPBCC domain-containing protein [Tessaracoccus rhinocerotis]TRY18538.1 polyketide cyclase [Tessaracoccus rhinocerotis]